MRANFPAMSAAEKNSATPQPSDAPSDAPLSPALLALGDAPDSGRRFAKVDDRRVLNETGMLSRRNLVTRFISWLFFRNIGFDERHRQTIRDTARAADVVYVMNHHSVLDYLYFNYALLRFSLPLAFVSNTIGTMLIFRPLWGIILHGLRRLFRYYKHQFEPHERLAYALQKRRASLIFLRKRQLWPWAGPSSTDDSFLATLLKAQIGRLRDEGETRSVHVVPQLLVWTQDPARAKKTVWNAVFGNPEAPSRVRKFLNFLINRRRTFVQIGKTIDLKDFIQRHADSTDLVELAAALRLEIQSNLSIEERVIKGPILKRAKQIREEILHDEDLKSQVIELAAEMNVPVDKLTKEIDGYLKEMAADFSMTTVEYICIAMTIVFNRIYSEIAVDHEGLERVREAARKSPLILLPCHRSHIDYLVISYLFYANGLVPPHIAAGKNLNFFPVGGIFRRGGAFFIRRSFRDNKPYSLVFREYLTKLVKEGYWIEFFIEGGRSRTGKMLSPKYGMLKIVVDAIRNKAAPDVQFVPIYVGYEQVIEEKAFSRELGGGDKKKENLGALLNATKVLWARYGRLYVNFGEPISCREALDRFDAQQARSDGHELNRTRDSQTRFLEGLGYRISDGINRVAVVTPTSLVAASLLFHDRRGISREVLLARVGLLLEFAVAGEARLSRTIEDGLRRHRESIAQARDMLEASQLWDARFALGEASPLARARGLAIHEAIDEVLARFIKLKHVEVHKFDDDEVVYVPVATARINLDFYKNNIIHLFVSEAILAAAIRGTLDEDRMTTVSRVMEAAAFLSRTFQHEFVFDPEKGFAVQFADTLRRFDTGSLIERQPGEDFTKVRIRVLPSGAATLELLHRALMPWVEAYWLIADALDTFYDGEPIPEALFIKKSQSLAGRRFQVGDITCPEAASNVNFQHALSAWEEFGLITRTRKGREKVIAPTDDPRESDRLSELRRRLRDFFA